MTNRTLLYSGLSGGKSTFLGGFYSHLGAHDETVVTCEELGEHTEFEEEILTPMLEQQQYPPQNPSRHAVRVTLERGSKFRKTATFLDFPNEVISDRRIDRPWNVDRDEAAVKERSEGMNPHQSIGPNPDEWETALAHEYNESDRVIFLVNLHKLLFSYENKLQFDAADVKAAAAEKEVAIVATATDLVDCEPEESVVDDGGLLEYVFGSGEPVDSALLDELRAELPSAASIRAKHILHTADEERDVAFFGVAVPCRDPVDDARSIATDDGTIETRGFENVVRWLG